MHEAENEITSDDKNMAVIAHILGLVLGFLGPLVIWLVKKDDSTFIAEHSRKALNFQISIAIYLTICSILIFVFIGILLIPAIMIINIVFVIKAAIAANNGQDYDYKFSLNLIK